MPSLSESRKGLLDNVGAVTESLLRVAKETSAGTGVPGLEGVLGGVLAIVDMIKLYRTNGKDVQEIEERVQRIYNDILKPIKDTATSDPRISSLPDIEVELMAAADALRTSAKSNSAISAFFKSKSIAENIKSALKSIDSALVRWHCAVDVQTRIIVGEMSQKLDKYEEQDMTWLEELEKVPEIVRASYLSSQKEPCLPGTREDVLSRLREGYLGNSARRITWLHGVPGSGKSALAATIADELANAPSLGRSSSECLGGSFFFLRGHSARSNPQHVIPTLSYQFAQSHPEFRRHLRNSVRTHPDAREARIPDQLRYLLVEPLRHCTSLPKNVVFVLDALDECGSHKQTAAKDLLRAITQVASLLPTNIRFIITSRPETPLTAVFASVSTMINEVDLGDLSFETGKDIRSFVTAKLCDPAYAHESGWAVEATQIDQIVDRAAGLFVYAATVVRELTAPGAVPQHHLESLMSASGDTDVLYPLHDLYSQVLNSFLDTSDTAIERASRIVLYRQFVGTLLCLHALLDVSAIATLAGVEGALQTKVVKLLPSVLHINPKDGVVSFHHSSFQEYITSAVTKATHPDLAFSPQELVCTDAELCLACFSAMDPRLLPPNICELSPTESMSFNKSIANMEERIIKLVSLQLRYAAVHWASHLPSDEVPPRLYRLVVDAVEAWCRVQVLTWFELMSLVGELERAASILRTAFDWLQVARYHSFPGQYPKTLLWDSLSAQRYMHQSDAGKIIADALRLLQMFHCAIERSAGHVYWTVLPFLPDCTLRDHYEAFMTKHSHAWAGKSPVVPQPTRLVKGRLRTWPVHLHTLLGHTGSIRSVAFSFDGARIVSGSRDKTIRIWDANTGAPVCEPMESHTHHIRSVAFSPDNKLVASGSDDKSIRLWDGNTGAAIRGPMHGHTGPIASLAFSLDSSRIVSGSDDKTIRIWDTNTGDPVGEPIRGHTHSVSFVAFLPHGKHIMSSSLDGTFRMWDASSGAPIGAPFQGSSGSIRSSALSLDGKRLAVGLLDNTIRVWDLEAGVMIGEPLEGHTDHVRSIAFSPYGKRIVSGSGDRSIRVWDARTGAAIGEPMLGHTNAVHSVAFSLDGTRVISGSEDRTVRIWDAETSRAISEPVRGHTKYILSVAFSPDSKRLVTGSLDKTACVWDVATCSTIGKPLKGHAGYVRSVAFSPDGKRIISGSNDKDVRIWDATTGEPIGEPMRGHTGFVWSVAVSQDGERVVSVSEDKTLRVWDATSRTTVGDPLRGHAGAIGAVAFSPDGKTIVSGSDDKTIRLWNASTGATIGEPLCGHTNSIWSIAFSPDGRKIASGSLDHTVRLWDAATGSAIGEPLTGHSKYVTSVAFSPSGHLVVSGSFDKTVRLWDANSGSPIGKPLEGHRHGVGCVAFSPDGKLIASGSDDKTVRLWDVSDFAETDKLLKPDVKVSRMNPYPQSVRAKHPFGFHLEDGWILDEHGRPLVWVPPSYRDGLSGPRCRILSAHMTVLDFSGLVSQ